MKRFVTCLAAGLVAGAVLSMVSQLAVAGDDATIEAPSDVRWRLVLKDQLKSEKNCDLLEVLTYSELKIGDEISISGKISCVDGREYDYSRPRQHQKFEIRLCEPSVC